MNNETKLYNISKPEKGNVLWTAEHPGIANVELAKRGDIILLDENRKPYIHRGIEDIAKDHSVDIKNNIFGNPNKTIVDGNTYAKAKNLGEIVILEPYRSPKIASAAAGVGFTILSLLPFSNCKKAPDDNIPQEVTITFDIADQMTGAGRTMTKQGYTNASMTVTAAETEISGVVAGYISVQDLSSGNILGSGNGSASFPTGNSTNYRVIRFHDGPGLKEIYDALVAQNIQLYAGRNPGFGRKDEPGLEYGKEAIWENVFNQVNNALASPFKLGSVSRGGTANWYGFKNEGDGGKEIGNHWIYVNPQNRSDIAQIAAGLEELTEYLGGFNNILGSTNERFITGSTLNSKGIAGERFVFAYVPVN
jgi:hypothetical protein